MNFSLSGGGIGLIGGFMLFAALLLAFAIVATIVVRMVRGGDDAPDGTDQAAGHHRPEEEDLV